MNLPSMARTLGGEVSSGQVLCPGPGHSRQDRSLAVRLNQSGEIVVYSFAGDDWGECRDYARDRLALPGFSPSRNGEPRRVDAQPAPQAKRPWKRELALRIWAEARDPRGTLAEAYLKFRTLELPDEAANEAIRYLALCPFGAERFPAMVCLVRNIVTDEPQAVHRTALAPDGTAIKRGGKTFRLSLGPIAGGAIKLDPDEDVTQGICIGEGVETTLSGRQMGLWPAWSLVSTGGISNFPILPGTEGLHIFAENDANGASAKAVEACARRWYEAGRDVFVITPDVGDLNDELREVAAK